MNESPDSKHSTDDASDPLLTALRQRLGDYSEAPSPGVWASIRQRLPPPVTARPWWRQPRRLLPLLVLLVGLVVTGSLVRHWVISSPPLATAPTAAGRHYLAFRLLLPGSALLYHNQPRRPTQSLYLRKHRSRH